MNAIPCLANLRRLAKEMGAIFHNQSSPKIHQYGIEAPPGQMWQACESHELICWWYVGPKEWSHEPIQDTLDRMAEGLMPCPDRESPDGRDWCDGEPT